MKPRNNLD